jgi:ABC-2 type transport system permease protein
MSPFFALLFKAALSGEAASRYNVLVLNGDSGAYSAALIGELKKESSLKVETPAHFSDAEKKIEDKTADILVLIPRNFSASFDSYLKTKKGRISPVKNYGDMTSPRFAAAAAYTDYKAYMLVSALTGSQNPMEIEFEHAGNAGSVKNMFDLFVPALIIFSFITLLFSAGASVIKETEKKTIQRLQLSKLTVFEFLSAITANQLIIGAACLGLTWFTAAALGYSTTGSVFLIMLAAMLTCFSVIAIAILTACFIRTMFGLLTVGCFPYFVLVFFSGCFFPLPQYKIFEIAGNPVFANDILPTAPGIRALNKIMNYNAGFAEIAFELALVAALGLIYFTIGAFLFKKQHMNKYK